MKMTAEKIITVGDILSARKDYDLLQLQSPSDRQKADLAVRAKNTRSPEYALRSFSEILLWKTLDDQIYIASRPDIAYFLKHAVFSLSHDRIPVKAKIFCEKKPNSEVPFCLEQMRAFVAFQEIVSSSMAQRPVSPLAIAKYLRNKGSYKMVSKIVPPSAPVFQEGVKLALLSDTLFSLTLNRSVPEKLALSIARATLDPREQMKAAMVFFNKGLTETRASMRLLFQGKRRLSVHVKAPEKLLPACQP